MKLKTSPIELKSKGNYSLAVYKSDGTEVKEKRVDKVDNVVTYVGAYKLFFDSTESLTDGFNAVVGTGTTEITRSSTSLGALLVESAVAITADRSTEVDNLDGTSTITATRTTNFSVGQVTGTISEIGLYNGDNDLVAGQLIKDELGDPTTITLLADEQLSLSYTIETTFPNGNPPTTAAVLGSGSVTTPTGSSNYTFYQQPLFADYDDTSELDTRFALHRRSYIPCDSTGSVITVFGDTFTAPTATHNGTGTVTVNYTSQTAAPADFSSTDIKFIGAGGRTATDSRNSINPTNKVAKSSGFDSDITLVIEFDTPLTKTSSESLTIHIEQVFTV